MSESGTEASGSSFSSAGGSSLASDNTDTRALNAVQEGASGEDGDDVDTNNKTIQEAVFATIYTLTKSRSLDTSLRVAILRVVLEFLQLFRVAFNSSFPWIIKHELWIFKAIEWTLFRMMAWQAGYNSFITVLYLLASLVVATMLLTGWVAVALKGDDAANPWLRRLVTVLQLVSFVLYNLFWPAVFDCCASLFDCDWPDLRSGMPAHHVFFEDHDCLAMPHLAHMLFAGVVLIVFAAMVLLMGTAGCDRNPLTRNLLASADANTTIKILVLKLVCVLVSTALDRMGTIQVVLMLISMYGVVYYTLDGAPFHSWVVNVIWGGLHIALLSTTTLLVGVTLAADKQPDPTSFTAAMSDAVLYAVAGSCVMGGGLMYLRLLYIQRLARRMEGALASCKAAALSGLAAAERVEKAAAGSSLLSLMGDLRRVYKFRDARQVALMMRHMRRWDDEGEPDAEAADFGEFVLKCGMARLPASAHLLTMHANLMVDVNHDGQAARSSLQGAQKAGGSVIDAYFMYVAQQQAKQLRRDGDGLDLLSYVEFQRMYRSCVRAHKLALVAQRQFWNCLLKDRVSFVDMQACFKRMEEAEQCATAVYRKTLERYPGNGKVMKVYARFLEFVRNEPGAAARFYDAAVKAGTSESLVSLTAGEEGATQLTCVAGTIDEKVDGLVIINAQGTIMMVNGATVGMFGYERGSLEGKNVSMLMPQPYSSHHDSFLQRYVQTNVPHILNKSRQMVALHRDRSMFPITLSVVRLSGVGADSLFMGVIRPAVSSALASNHVVNFHIAADGIVLCPDKSCMDAFGIQPVDVIGRSFSNLTTDVEGVSKFISEAARSSEGVEGAVAATFTTKMLHGFLPPVDVLLSFELGGALESGSAFRSIILAVRVLAEPCATLVVDHKGRIVYANSRLGSLLNQPLAALTRMELNALLPQPFCQIHGAWFKDPPAVKPATSCRSGAVVHLLASNGAKVPVTLQMSTREDMATGHVTHVIQVSKATEEQRINQQRLLLSVNHKGIILATNADASKAVFGFDAAAMLPGQPLSACIDVFASWRDRFGDEASLLQMLAAQAMAASTEGAAACRQAGGAWRVGVHKPAIPGLSSSLAPSAAPLVGVDGDGGAALQGTATSSVLHLLQQRRVLPACMRLDVLTQDAGDLILTAGMADSTAVLQVSLYRSEALTGALELDSHLRVAKADESACLLLGAASKHLHGQHVGKLLVLPGIKRFEDLLGSKGAAAKKGAMKGGAAAASGAARTGSIRLVTVPHLADGKPLPLSMQALSYDQATRTRLLVRLQPHNPVSAALDRLLQLSQGGAAAVEPLQATIDDAASAEDHHSRGSSPSGSLYAGAVDSPRPPRKDAPADSTGRPGGNVADWVRMASRLHVPADEEGGFEEADARQQHGRSRPRGDGTVAVRISRPQLTTPGHAASPRSGKAAGDAPGKGGKGGTAYGSESGDDNEDDAPHRRAGLQAPAAAGSDGGSEGGVGSFHGSMMDDGASEMGASDVGGSSAAGGLGHEEDLAVDMRRAKRLKKLHRMLNSSMAQAPAKAWRLHTLVVLGVILVAHIACFVVLTSQIDARRANAVGANDIGLALAASTRCVLRLNFLKNCLSTANPEFKTYPACESSLIDEYAVKLLLNTQEFSTKHMAIYLGPDKLQPFKDPRLLEYWTYTELPEAMFFEKGRSSLPERWNSTRTLWTMGNMFTQACLTVYFNLQAWGANLAAHFPFEYAMNNGPNSLFTGYAWSLDTFVDYTWRDLTSLSVILIILLVVEVVVEIVCVWYKLVLVQRCHVAHMRMFSVFMAFPSATVRLMSRQPTVVDETQKDDMDEDDIDLVDAGPPNAGDSGGGAADGGGDGGAAATDKGKKSVRLAASGASDDEGEGDAKGIQPAPKASSKKKGKPSLSASAKAKAPKSVVETWWKATHKTLFGWMDPSFKRNGKRLVPSSLVVLRFMAPLMLWVGAVVVISGVSYMKLQGLQGPLASLDLSVHVLYRLSRCRLAANFLGFSTTPQERAVHRAETLTNLALLRQDYEALLYGGRMHLLANVSFDAVAPASVFADEAVASFFFKTKQCLRKDKSTCFKPGDEWYDVTHSGLDVQMQWYLDKVNAFANLPDNATTAGHPIYNYFIRVTAADTYDGMVTAAQVFVDYTLSRLDAVKQLHIIMLAISICCALLFVVLLYRPHIRLLHRDTRAVINMLSQLPNDVDVEGHVKSIVLGISSKPAADPVAGSTSRLGADGMGGGPQGPYGYGALPAPGAMMLPPGAGAQQGGRWGGGAGHAAGGEGGGWFGRRAAGGAGGAGADARMWNYGGGRYGGPAGMQGYMQGNMA